MSLITSFSFRLKNVSSRSRWRRYKTLEKQKSRASSVRTFPSTLGTYYAGAPLIQLKKFSKTSEVAVCLLLLLLLLLLLKIGPRFPNTFVVGRKVLEKSSSLPRRRLAVHHVMSKELREFVCGAQLRKRVQHQHTTYIYGVWSDLYLSSSHPRASPSRYINHSGLLGSFCSVQISSIDW